MIMISLFFVTDGIAMFGPNDAAVDAIPADVMAALQSDPDLLRQVTD